MTSVTRFASLNKHNVPCIVELITPLQMNIIGNTPSHKPACYGNYVNLWMELKLSGVLMHMEQIMQTRHNRRSPKRRRIIQQAIQQYVTMKSYRHEIKPTREFMRFVVLLDTMFDTENTFGWVNITFIEHVITVLSQQITYIGLSSNLVFEHKVNTAHVRGRCDIYDVDTSTVVEIKTCRFIHKEHFIQLHMYKKLASAKRAFLINCVDGSIWRLI